MFTRVYCYNGIPKRKWFGLVTVYDHDFVIVSVSTKMDKTGEIYYIVSMVCCRCDATRMEIMTKQELYMLFYSLTKQKRIGEYRKLESFLKSE